MLADAVVHTTGVNWESVAVICGVVSSVILGFGTLIGRNISKRATLIAKATKTETADTARESAETVARRIVDDIDKQFEVINRHLIYQDTRIQSHGERLARIEGKLGLPRFRDVDPGAPE